MDFELGEDQRAVVEAVAGLLARHAGSERAIALAAGAESDAALERALDEAGFLDLFAEAGSLEAALLVESVARAAGLAPVAARALVAPALLGDRRLDGPVALAAVGPDAEPAPVRYAAHARYALLLAGGEAKLATLGSGAVEPVRSSFGYPFGRIGGDAIAGAETLGPGSGERLRRWWRTALAVEIAGTAAAAFDLTLVYVKQRRQFGRAIGSFQSVQHRLARLAAGVQATRWLALEAAHAGAPGEAAAVAASHAAATAKQVFDETHQFSGAMGFTREHDLHVYSMRLQALRLELGGVDAHRRAAAAARWQAAS